MSDFCPLLKKSCIKHECSWYIQVMGKNPNTGLDVNEFSCAISWMPMLLIENSQQTRQAGAAIESFRNEVVKEANENPMFLPHENPEISSITINPLEREQKKIK